MRWKFLVPVLVLAGVVPTVRAQEPQGSGDGLVNALFSPFRRLAEVLIDVLVSVLANTPTIHPNPPVQEIHGLSLMVVYASAGMVVMAAGLHYIIGLEIGVSYEEVRMILPRLIAALLFSIVSLQLLQFGAGASDAFVEAFRPQEPINLEQLAGLTTSLVLVWVVNATLLLALVVFFILRDAYLLFVAAISPLLALAWVLPNTRHYSQSFIGGWWALLAAAPLDVLVLRFNLTMLEASGVLGMQPVSNWILGVASFTLMLWVPYQLYSVSQSAVFRASRIVSQFGGKPPRGGSGGAGPDDGSDWDGERSRDQRRRDRRRRR